MPNEAVCSDCVPRRQRQPQVPIAIAQQHMKRVQLQICYGFSVTGPRVEEETCEVKSCAAVAWMRR